MSTLLPCPFCGSTDVAVSHTVQGSCWVVCETAACGAIGPTKPTPAEATSAWNMRVLAVGGDMGVAWPESSPAPGPLEAVLPVEMESRLVGDIAGFRARDVELCEELDLKGCTKTAFDPLRAASHLAAQASCARESLP
jgi:Lar family restriction alleviation protein